MQNLFKKLEFDFSEWNNLRFILQLVISVSFLNFVLIINYYATLHATANSGQPVDDVFFKILPYVNTSYIDKYGAYYISLLVLFFVIFYSKKAVQLVTSLAILILVRDFFINLTYIGIPPGIEPTKSFFTQGGDLFFSGHTALPFMVVLIFWENKYLRYLFLGITVVMGSEVLLGRYHYSIDVFSAPFFTFGVFCFVKYILKNWPNGIY